MEWFFWPDALKNSLSLSFSLSLTLSQELVYVRHDDGPDSGGPAPAFWAGLPAHAQYRLHATGEKNTSIPSLTPQSPPCVNEISIIHQCLWWDVVIWWAASLAWLAWCRGLLVASFCPVAITGIVVTLAVCCLSDLLCSQCLLSFHCWLNGYFSSVCRLSS